MGFIEETGAAQYYRDARIAPIYEGTNGIQAADLVGRKLGSDGMAAKELEYDIKAFLDSDLPADFKADCEGLKSALKMFSAATDHLLAQKSGAPLDVATAATTYLTLCGDLIGGWLLLKGAVAAHNQMESGDTTWLTDRIKLMRVFFAYILSHAPAHLAAAKSGYDALDGLVLSLD